MGLFIPKKYLFTQLSGIVVGCSSFLLSVVGINRFFPLLMDFNTGSVFIKIGVFIGASILGLVGSMVVWGRILVMLGILSKDEAKGYPYSKPWDNDRSK